MGQILIANCKKCGFQKEFLFGGGMRNFKTVCNVPAINKSTGEFAVENILKKDKLTGSFTFYNEPELYVGNPETEELQWCDVVLKENDNLCPYCKEFTIVFNVMGCFD